MGLAGQTVLFFGGFDRMDPEHEQIGVKLRLKVDLTTGAAGVSKIFTAITCMGTMTCFALMQHFVKTHHPTAAFMWTCVGIGVAFVAFACMYVTIFLVKDAADAIATLRKWEEDGD